MLRPLSIIILFLIFSCSSEQPQGVSVQGQDSGRGELKETLPQPVSGTIPAGSPALEIIPSEASRKTTLTLKSRGFMVSNAEVEWLVDKKPVTSSPSHQLSASGLRKGAVVQAKAKATTDGTEVLSNIITISNAPPEISSLKILPEVFKPGDTLSVDAAATDADDDEVTIHYQWTVNGEPAGESRKIDAAVKRGDIIVIRITPFDGEDYGTAVVMKREIRNLPPMISDKEYVRFDGAVFSYRITATDPDGDTLSFSLKSAPDGMTVRKDTGLISWDVPAEFTGKTEFIAVVSDGNGGESTKSYAFDISPGPKKAKAP